MISWIQIQKQIERYIEKRLQTEEDFQSIKQHYNDLLHNELAVNWDYWKEYASKAPTSHLIPDFDEPPNRTYPVEQSPSPSILIATDGSQIFPSRHEIAPVALINISRIRIDYVNYQEEPLLDAVSTLLMREDFDWVEPEREISFQDLVSDRRTLDELNVLASLSKETSAKSNNKRDLKVTSLVDGSLVLWRLAGRALQKYEQSILSSYCSSLDIFRELGFPIAGYISNSGSREVTQLVQLVQEQTIEKKASETMLWDTKSPSPLITDTVLFASLLKKGERSTLFHSRSKILDNYGDHKISFFYLHIGNEIAKIELPRWATKKQEMVNQIASVCFQQAQIGGGYPIVLAEAHEQAVIRKEDRFTFYALLEENMLQKGIDTTVSAKEIRKRVSIL